MVNDQKIQNAEHIKWLRDALKVFASDATLFPSTPSNLRNEARPAMYFAVADYDRARAVLAATDDNSLRS